MSSSFRGGAGDGDTLVYALRVIRERRWLIAGITAAFTVLALLFSASQTKTYEGVAQVVFGQTQVQDQVLGTPSQSGAPERDAATRVLVATSAEVARRVQKRLKTDTPAETLLEAVAVEAEPNADVLNFTASSEQPKTAADVANAFATEYIAFERETLLAEIARAKREYNKRLSLLQPGTTAFEDLRQQRDRLTALQDLGAAESQLISRAEVPTSPASPQPRRDAALGLVIGLILGLTVAFLLDLLDRRVKTVPDIERMYGRPALASIPRDSFVVSSAELSSVAFEPYRILRTAVSFAEARRETKVVLVTSAVAGEGKSSVALNLVRAFAQASQPAILVEADLRRPSLRHRLEIDDREGGLTTALTGRHRARDLLRELPGEQGSGALILPAGPLAPNAPELLSSRRMVEVLEELSAGPEVIVIDAAPLLPVADTQVLLDNPRVDATLIVGRVFETKREDIRRCRTVFEQHDSLPLGVVVTGVDPQQRYEYDRPERTARSAPPALAR